MAIRKDTKEKKKRRKRKRKRKRRKYVHGKAKRGSLETNTHLRKQIPKMEEKLKIKMINGERKRILKNDPPGVGPEPPPSCWRYPTARPRRQLI